MGSFKISFTISAAPAITNYFIAVLYKTTAPSAEIARVLLGNVHTSPQNVQFNDLDSGNYIVKVHESVDNSTLGNLRHDWWENALSNRLLTEQRFYHVDGGDTYDPLNGSTNITDPYFEGKIITGLFQEGYRPLKPDTEWHQDTGGILNYLTDINSGSQITNASNQVWVVEITNAISAPDGANDTYVEVVNVTADITLDGTQYSKIVAVAATATTQTTTLPAIGTVPEKRGYIIQHDGGNAINVKVLAGSGEIIRFRGADVNYLLLGKGEFVKIVKKIVGSTSKWYVIDYEGQWMRIGEQIASDILLDNSVYKDGSAYDGNIYKRLYDFVANTIPNAQKTTITIWLANADKQSLYGIDTVAKTVRVPLFLNLSTRYLKNIGGSDSLRSDNVPGGFQAGQVGEFDGLVTIPLDQTSIDETGVGRITTGHSVNEPSDLIVHMKFQTGKDNIVKNAGAYPLLLI